MTTKLKKFFKTVGEEPEQGDIRSALENMYGDMNLTDLARNYFTSARRTVGPAGEILKKFLVLFKVMYPNPATLAVHLSKVRKTIKTAKLGPRKNQVQPPALYKLSLSEEYFNQPKEIINDMYQKSIVRVEEANKNLTQINLGELTEAIERLDKAGDPYSRGVLLMLCSGMRPIELFKNVVEPDPADSRYILVGNLAKKRGDRLRVRRPVIGMSPESFINRLAAFRQYFDNKKPLDKDGFLSGNVVRGLNAAARAVFPELEGKSQAGSMMRKYYSAAAFELFADKEKTNYNVFIKNLLGHNILSTSFNYSMVNVSGDPEDEERAHDAELEEVPEHKDPEFKKIARNAPKAAKIEYLEHIYRIKPLISNAALRKASGVGAAIVNEFLSRKRLGESEEPNFEALAGEMQ